MIVHRYIPHDPAGRTRIELGAHRTEDEAWRAASRWKRRDRDHLETKGWTVWAHTVTVAPAVVPAPIPARASRAA